MYLVRVWMLYHPQPARTTSAPGSAHTEARRSANKEGSLRESSYSCISLSCQDVLSSEDCCGTAGRRGAVWSWRVSTWRATGIERKSRAGPDRAAQVGAAVRAGYAGDARRVPDDPRPGLAGSGCGGGGTEVPQRRGRAGLAGRARSGVAGAGGHRGVCYGTRTDAASIAA